MSHSFYLYHIFFIVDNINCIVTKAKCNVLAVTLLNKKNYILINDYNFWFSGKGSMVSILHNFTSNHIYLWK